MILSLFFYLNFSHSAWASPIEPAQSTISAENDVCRIVVPQQNARLASELLTICRATYRRAAKQFGITDDKRPSRIEVRVVQHPRDMKSAAPPNAEPPSWSNAVAYPQDNLIILSLLTHMGSPIDDLNVVLEHELSHLAMRQLVGEARIPRWFSEGIAIQQSEHSSFRRYWLVWLAARGNNLLPLASIERYPEEFGRINLAYAQAADFVGYLLRRDGWLGVRIVIREIARGRSFTQAFELAYRDNLGTLEEDWRVGLGSRWQLLPLITGTGALWGLIVILFLVAYTAARRRKRKRLSEMEEEETEVVVVGEFNVPSRPAPRKIPDVSHIPTKIRIDDEIHTLH